MNSLLDQLGEYGRVLTAFVGDKNITVMGSEHEGGDKGIHDRDVAMLEESKGKLLEPVCCKKQQKKVPDQFLTSYWFAE